MGFKVYMEKKIKLDLIDMNIVIIKKEICKLKL